MAQLVQRERDVLQAYSPGTNADSIGAGDWGTITTLDVGAYNGRKGCYGVGAAFDPTNSTLQGQAWAVRLRGDNGGTYTELWRANVPAGQSVIDHDVCYFSIPGADLTFYLEFYNGGEAAVSAGEIFGWVTGNYASMS